MISVVYIIFKGYLPGIIGKKKKKKKKKKKTFSFAMK